MLWSFLGPLLKATVFYLIFHEIWGRSVTHFGLKILVGVVALQFFHSIVQYSQQGIRQGQGTALHTTVPFEVLLFPTYAVPTLKLMTELTICWLAAAFFAGAGIMVWVRLLALGLLLLAFSIGTGLLIASLQTLARDISEIWHHLSPLLLFLTPVFYSLDRLPENVAGIVRALNPLCPFVLAFQSSLTASPVPGAGGAWIASIAWSAGALAAGYTVFRALEKEIVENL
ncbi:MAG: hypothetical protein MOGMAGMI_01541 [Candidatus Omnitrophica bacterium]|nr:hypothetical protein [Candidatus Omnitrophota bacterium]